MVQNTPTRVDTHRASTPPISASVGAHITLVDLFGAKEIVSAPHLEPENEWAYHRGHWTFFGLTCCRRYLCWRNVSLLKKRLQGVQRSKCGQEHSPLNAPALAQALKLSNAAQMVRAYVAFHALPPADDF